MPEWLVEFDGRQKPLPDIADARFQDAVAPAKRLIEEALQSIDAADLTELQVVFWVDPEEGLKFTLRGPPVAVNLAVDAIGPLASLGRPSH